MECNKDEAIHVQKLSETKMGNNDFEGARRLALKAQSLYPALHNIAQLICVCEVHCSYRKGAESTDKDWYGILQMENLADEAKIKKQYRKLALLLHPDKNQLPGAGVAFQFISQAYSLLTNAKEKSIYDLKIRNAGKSSPVRPPHMKASSNSNKDTNVFGNLNQRQAAASSSGQPGVDMPPEPQPTVFQQKVVQNQGNSKMGGQNGQGPTAPHAGPHGIFNMKAAAEKTSVPMESSSKGARKRKDAGKVNGVASNGEPVDLKSKKSRKNHAMGGEVESDLEPDSNSEDNSDGNMLKCPDPEFYEFDKERDPANFGVGEIWACYDELDSMPRFYAKVKMATASPFQVQFRWLYPAPKDKDHKKWVDQGLPVGCGTYKLGGDEKSSVLETFSHKMVPFKQDKKNGPLMIYPNVGEVWALHKDWDINWSSNPGNHKVLKYEIVEVLSDFVANVGIKVSYLDKVAGFVSLFCRASLSESYTFLIGSQEVFKFAHRIPSCKMIGAEKEGVPTDSFELDPASLPLDPGYLHFPIKAKMKGGSKKGGRSSKT